MDTKHPEENYQKLLENLEQETRQHEMTRQTLEETQARLEHALEMFPAGIYEIDFKTGKITNVNQAMCHYSGYSREEFLTLRPQDILTPESNALYQQRARNFLSGKPISGEVKYTIRKKSGEEILCLLTNHFLYRDNMPQGALVIIRDVTGEWNTQKIMRAQAMALEQSFDGIAMFSMDHKAIFINQAWAKMHGYASPRELIGQDLRIFHSREQFEKQVLPNIANPDCDGASDLRVRHVTRDGREFPTRMSTSIIKDDTGRPVALLAIAQDITESLRMEESLRQAHKMEAIGTLAGGIAHDFNNILYPIMGYAELALDEMSSNEPAKEYIGEIVRATERAKSLVSQILSFSRPEEEKQKPLKLTSVVQEALHLIRAATPSTVFIQEDIQDGAGLILGNATQIHQVIMNLCTNAYQAMQEQGGLLRVSTRQTTLDRASIPALSRLIPGRYIQLEIQDTGTGMEPHVASRIFEPYYTTKAQGEGTGMGLAMVHSIMAKHRGDIFVETRQGQGTTFTLYFPMLRLQSISRKPGTPVRSVRGNEKILLVDDELSILKMLGMALERLGYQVFSHNNSIDALDAFRLRPDHFDLAVLDVTMPHMTGDVLLQHIKEIRPSLPCILCTGFNQKIDENQAKALGACQFLSKPLSTKVLATAIRRAMEKPGQ